MKRMPGPPPRPLAERFWEKVAHSDGCWNWTASRGNTGYGAFEMKVRGRWTPLGAHRIAWQLTKGPIPPGLCVLHHCDNRLCVNPEHLFLGTKGDNARDCREKGRTTFVGGAVATERLRRGESHPRSRLTDAKVAEIRRRRAAGEILRTIAADLGVSIALVHMVAAGQGWKHVT